MSKKIRSPKIIFSGFNFWGIPLWSLACIVPLILAKALPQTKHEITAPALEQKIENPSLPQPNLSFDDNTTDLAAQSPQLKNPTVYQGKKPTVDKQPLAKVVEQYQDEESNESIEPTAKPQVSPDVQPKPVQNLVKHEAKQKPTPQKTVARKTISKHPTTPVNYNPPAIEIKVMLENGANSLAVSTSNSGAIADTQGKILRNISANQGLTVTARGNSLIVDGEEFPSMIWIQPNSDGLVYVGDGWYRGRLLLVSQGGGVLAVNYVDLEQYLYSVVGTEMHPTAPREALKAQAIASRSYALVHIIRPASSWYHLGATQRWQAYKGIQKEYNTSQKAVNDTAGQILSYKGGVVESLYAATDEIVARAHGGMGMSQTGAYKLAENGYDYLQILGNYYPGVGVARVVTQQ